LLPASTPAQLGLVARAGVPQLGIIGSYGAHGPHLPAVALRYQNVMAGRDQGIAAALVGADLGVVERTASGLPNPVFAVVSERGCHIRVS
jgi:hypothetical protein